MNERDPIKAAKALAEAVKEKGGRVYYVGGCVRDRLMHRPIKDIDAEVHGIGVETLEGILEGLGAYRAVGKSFGIYQLAHCALDIALPRREDAIGRGHRDFRVTVDPFIGEEKAAMRRDFTVNALMQDVLTGEVLDFFGGIEDIQKKQLRHVNDRAFGEDALRVLRGAQFAARFGFSICPETEALCRGIALEDLSAERVMGELEKALTGAEKPSVFFENLYRMEKLAPWFAEAGEPAGWRLLDRAAALREKTVRPLGFMLAAMAVMEGTETGVVRLTTEASLRRYVRNMLSLIQRAPTLRDEIEALGFFDEAESPEELLLLCRAVKSGDGEKLAAWLALYRERTAEPAIQGRELISAGAKPGAEIAPALRFARRLQLAGLSRGEIVKKTLESLGIV